MLYEVITLDFGAQYSQLIARRVREMNVYSQIVPFTTPAADLKAMQPKGIIFSGGPASVRAENSPRPDAGIYDLGIRITSYNVCYTKLLRSLDVEPRKQYLAVSAAFC